MIGISGSFLAAFLVFVTAMTVFFAIGLSVLILFLRMRRVRSQRLARVSSAERQGRAQREEILRRQSSRKRGGSRRWTEGGTETQTWLQKGHAWLNLRLLRANLDLSGLEILAIFLVTFGLASVCALVITGGAFLQSLILGAILALLILDVVLRFLISRGRARFLAQLPGALDSIVRGTRFGVSVNECIRTIARDFDPPISRHFQAIADRIHLGQKIDAAIWQQAEIIEAREMDFFANTIAIQIESGGSMGEVLGKLSDLLRKRKALRLKVKATSSEAKASAVIIGSLPFAMALILWFVSPDYLVPLFREEVGRILLGIGLTSILVGFYVMYRMTQFKV